MAKTFTVSASAAPSAAQIAAILAASAKLAARGIEGADAAALLADLGIGSAPTATAAAPSGKTRAELRAEREAARAARVASYVKPDAELLSAIWADGMAYDEAKAAGVDYKMRNWAAYRAWTFAKSEADALRVKSDMLPTIRSAYGLGA